MIEIKIHLIELYFIISILIAIVYHIAKEQDYPKNTEYFFMLFIRLIMCWLFIPMCLFYELPKIIFNNEKEEKKHQ